MSSFAALRESISPFQTPFGGFRARRFSFSSIRIAHFFNSRARPTMSHRVGIAA